MFGARQTLIVRMNVLPPWRTNGGAAPLVQADVYAQPIPEFPDRMDEWASLIYEADSRHQHEYLTAMACE